MEQLTSELDIIFNGFIQKLRNTVQNTSTLNLRPEINDIILESISTVSFKIELLILKSFNCILKYRFFSVYN